jgi:hypothetical protein
MGCKPKTETSTATIGFEAKLWLTADKLRNNMDAAEYKHVGLGEMRPPYKGRIYDTAWGSGGSLPASRLCGVRFAEKDRAIALGVVQLEEFAESHGGVAKCEVRSASFEVKTSRPFVIRNSSFDILPGTEHADTVRRDFHPGLRA